MLSKQEKKRAYERAYKLRLRHAALAFYGPNCQCCGESQFEFLGIDHIEGGGTAHRKALNGTHLNQWLAKNKYPAGFQVLCHNCNLAKGFYGSCPHKAV